LKFSRWLKLKFAYLTTLGGFYTAFSHTETWPSG
jgi:hypothetical protein